jgi:hypothetical protein
MCIAILNKSSMLSKKSLKNCWDNNYHGAGIGYIDGNELRSYHESTSFDSFYEEYKFIRQLTDQPMMLHFRIATHGMGKDMLHPHEVTHGKVTLVHNGIIRGLGDNRISDTREFAELLGNFRPKNVSFIDHKGVRGFAMHLLGGTNKVILMDNRGAFRILNETLGHWDKNNDTWYSNASYKERQDYVWYGNTKVSNGSNYGKGQTAIPHYNNERQPAERWEWDGKEWIKEANAKWDENKRSWVKALPPSTPPPATTQAQGFNRGTYNGYGTLEARDKHLADVKRFEAQHVKLLKQGLVDNSYLTDLEEGLY